MELTQKNLERIGVLILIAILAILVFILIKPIVLSIIGGMVLAYAFFPVYRLVLKHVKEKNTSAALVSIFLLLLLIVPAYFIVPLIISEVFDFFQYSQTITIGDFIKKLFPGAADAFIAQISNSFTSITSEISSGILHSLVGLFLEIPKILFNLAIIAFVFFFSLRDHEKLISFVSSLSPLNKLQEQKLVQQFKNITNSIVYGQIVIGLVQGIAAGLGFFVFGVPRALLLTILATILSIVPLLGPLFIWIPAGIYLLLTGDTLPAVLFLIYNVLVVSNIDNLLRLYLVTRRTQLSQVIVLIGMIGGLFIFGILGLILGPLILAYFIVFLDAYRQNALSSLFKFEEPK